MSLLLSGYVLSSSPAWIVTGKAQGEVAARQLPDGTVRVLGHETDSVRLRELLAKRWSVVVLLSEAPKDDQIVFPSALVNHFGGERFQYVYILPRAALRALEFDQVARNILFTEALEPNLFERLGLRHRSDSHTFLISPDGTIRLSVDGVPRNDLLRQVCERTILGAADYEIPPSSPGLSVGREIPSVPVRSINGAGALLHEIIHPGDIVVFLTSGCATCGASNSLGYLRKISGLKKQGAFEGKRLVVLFSRVTPLGLLSDDAGELDLAAESWRADRPIPGWEDIYHSMPMQPDIVPIVLMTRSGGTIVSIQRIDAWLQSVFGASSERKEK
jgi:hypothetical protein